MDASACLIDVPWETRNLGVRSFAVADAFFEKPDTPILGAAMKRVLEEFKKIFIQARVPKGGMAGVPILEGLGFSFIEATLCPHAVLGTNEILKNFIQDRTAFLPRRAGRENISFISVDKGDSVLKEAIKNIARESFSDDRFHLDSRCDFRIADGRMAFWVADLYADPAVCFYVLRLGAEAVAFMARKADDLILAGFAKKYVNSGLGDYFWLSVMEDMLVNEKIQSAHTLISAHNTAVLNLYARNGFKFRDSCATFHYWGGGIG